MNLKSNIAIISTSRSEFGVLKEVILHLSKISKLTLFIGGSHLVDNSSSEEIKNFIHTLDLNAVELNHSEIEKINSLNPLKQVSVLGEMSKLMVSHLEKLNIDLLVMLGDRWELLSAATSALFVRIPVAHISGGEVTEAAIDENIRHSITKMSHLHFVACEKYAENVSSMGEEDWRITISGETGLDWIYKNKIINFEQTMNKLGIPTNNRLILFTYHPISYGNDSLLKEEISQICISLKSLKEFTVLITGPGYEIGSEYVRAEFRKIIKQEKHIFYHENLGRENYLSIMSGAVMVLGNSSSGIYESPSLGIKSINIGDRQKGRERASSTIDIPCSSELITKTVRENIKINGKIKDKLIQNPYDPFKDGRNSQRVARACVNALNVFTRNQLLHKKFCKDINKNQWNSTLTKDIEY